MSTASFAARAKKQWAKTFRAGTWSRLGLTILTLVVFFTVFRLFFLTHNYNRYQDIPTATLIGAFLEGIRFDMSTLSVINTPLILFTIAKLFYTGDTVIRRIIDSVIFTLFVCLNTLAGWINIFDIEYFRFSARRSTPALFYLKQDATQELGQLLSQYWFFFSACLLFMIIIWRLGRFAMTARKNQHQTRTSGRIIQAILVLMITTLAIRGGFQQKPLTIAHAFGFTAKATGDLILNSAFSMMHASRKSGVSDVNYFADWKKVIDQINAPAPEPRPKKKDNVVILILESFGAEYLGFDNAKGYTPFLDSLIPRSHYFRNHFANGRRSIEAMTSITVGIPSLMEEPIISSIYSGNEMHGLPETLNQEGYTTAFFHGGQNGTMFFDVMASLAGFRKYYGLNEYPISGDFDGAWGIYDEPFLQFSVSEMSSWQEPFFSTIFTLSSHNPYKIPDQYSGKFPRGTLPIHESIGYTDYALAKFFSAAEKQNWYDHTLFIITGDHTSLSESHAYESELGGYRVPLLFFHPGGAIPPTIDSKVAQHVDITPTVLHYLGIQPSKHLLFGHSLFDQNFPGRCINQLFGNYWLIYNQSFIKIFPDNRAALFEFNGKLDRNAELTDPALRESKLRELEAFIQYFNNGLNKDSLYQHSY